MGDIAPYHLLPQRTQSLHRNHVESQGWFLHRGPHHRMGK